MFGVCKKQKHIRINFYRNLLQGSVHTCNWEKKALAFIWTLSLEKCAEHFIIHEWAIHVGITNIAQMNACLGCTFALVQSNTNWGLSTNWPEQFIIVFWAINFAITNIGPRNTIGTFTLELVVTNKGSAVLKMATSLAGLQSSSAVQPKCTNIMNIEVCGTPWFALNFVWDSNLLLGIDW